MSEQPEKVFCTVREAAHMMSISETGIWRLVHRGELESVKIGHARRIRVESIRRFGMPDSSIDSKSDGSHLTKADTA
jgi:excisionase family DNA binding protein